jgi:hypothetical protein
MRFDDKMSQTSKQEAEGEGFEQGRSDKDRCGSSGVAMPTGEAAIH